MRSQLNFLSTIILYCLNEFKGERTVFGIYHLLTGKKSAQTIQDGKLYRISQLFQSFPYLKKETFAQYVKRLEGKGYIVEREQAKWILTQEGQGYLQEQLDRFPLSPYLDGWRYMNVSLLFLSRLTLLIQTLSHLVYHETYFLPVTHDMKVLNWTKGFLKRQRLSRSDLARQLFYELSVCLERRHSTEADLFVLQFSGFKRAGLTKKQIADLYGMDEHRVHYLQVSVLHFCLQKIMEDEKAFPILASLIPEAASSVPLTISTMKTLELLKQGKTIEDITAIRRLKQSTIEDHLVELALFVPDFSIAPYVSDQLQKKIMTVIEQAQTNKLKDIKEALREEATYFQIRMVLARYFG
ncbi:helix-turn-helix domain-containing protein [Bacillus songklensis]|uniref:helix-turn-helix domain-containing protein n=1 Tax=Bacillus songklensis TaxID=1069116 RepID=UPI0036734CC3